MTPLSRGIISSGKLGGIAPVTAFYDTLALISATQGVTVDNDTSLDLGSDDFTMSLWFLQTSLSVSAGRIMSKFFDTSGDLSWFWGHEPSSNNVQFHSSPDGSESTTVASFAWEPVFNVRYHLALERSGTTLKMFVDGAQVGTDQSVVASIFQNIEKLGVATYTTNGGIGFDNGLNGSITNAIITKTTGVVTELYNGGESRQPNEYSTAITNDMILGLPLNDGDANPETDVSGFGNDATLIGSPTYTGAQVEFTL